MNKFLYLLASLLCIFGSCTSKKSKNILTVAATPVPQAEILEYIQSDLQAKGILLKIVTVNDYNTPNRMLAEGEVDANYFQHMPFLQEQIEQFHYPIVCLTKVHLEPMGLYSDKIKNIDELTESDTIAIPSDPANEGRALLLLHHHGVITLRDPNNLLSTVRDIESNPLELRFSEVDAAMLPRTLPDVDAAIINTNFALQADLNPLKNALLLESEDSPYANIVAIRKENENDPKLKILAEALNSDKVKQYILKKYQGAIIPSFGKCSS